MPTWPSTLPQQLELAGLTVQEAETRIATNTDTGPGKVRNRFTAGVQPVTGAVTLTSAQLATFETFYRSTLQRGTLSFTWVHPDTGATATLAFQRNQVPSKTRLGAAFRVTLPLEVLP